MIRVDASSVLHNRLGHFRHVDMVGRPFGTQMWSVEGTKHCHLVRPTPELWTRVLPHRTQILYMPDIALILEMMDVTRGSIVVESGTGSGSFSHSIARAVGASGHLYTFDFHEERAAKATKEFADHRLEGIITSRARDVCTDGFGLDPIADAGRHHGAMHVCRSGRRA